MKYIAIIVFGLFSTFVQGVASTDAGKVCRFQLTVTTPLRHANVPMDPVIDFSKLIRESGRSGVLDPNSIQVFDLTSGTLVSHVVTDDFAYGDTGRIEWVIEKPTHTRYEIRFSITQNRPTLKPQAQRVPIGVGDLLRYNSGIARPVTLFSAAGLVDLNGDGRTDLAGCWNYAYRPGDPWDGIVCYPGQQKSGFEFGDLTRLRYLEKNSKTEPKHFRHTYMAADFADFNRDGLMDLVQTRRGVRSATFYLNAGKSEAGGMPIFAPSDSIAVSGWQACRAVDLNGDGSLDLVIDGTYLRNTNSRGWPFQAAKPVPLDAGRQPCFFDVDRDGRLDAVCLQGGPNAQPDGYRIAWRRNLGGDPPKFAAELLVEGIDQNWCTFVSAVENGDESGLLVQHNVFQNLSFYQRKTGARTSPRFEFKGRMESKSAVLSLSDQAWPCVCDWDDDGDFDLLVGGGYGWPRIVINEGSNSHPSYAEPKRIYAEGKPIRFLRNDILGPPLHGHNMGYPYPVFIDWDGDTLSDLVCPNETNRIFWYRNIGSKSKPKFGPRQQILVEGFPDSPEAKRKSAQRAIKATYPTEKNRPFFWRTAAAFADWNGDGLTDLITHDGLTRQATLLTQFRDDDGQLRLQKDQPVTLKDGRPIDDRIVNRKAHWTEGFRAFDWDGDGLIDLIYNCAGAHHGIQDGGSIYLLRNCGTKSKPLFENPVTMRCFGEPIRITNHGPNAWPCDFDGDGKGDLVACVEWSVYPFYRHAALTMKSRPKYQLGKVSVDEQP